MVNGDSPERREYIESVIRMRNIENQAASARNQLGTYETALVEILTTREALRALKKQTKDEPSLLPLGSGVFVEGTLKKKDKILIDIGAGAILEKTVAQGLEMLEERETNIRQAVSNFQNILTNLERTYIQTAQKAQELEKKMQ